MGHGHANALVGWTLQGNVARPGSFVSASAVAARKADNGSAAAHVTAVLAGSGYVSEENFARADADGLRLLAPLAKDPAGATTAPPKEPGTWTCSRPQPGPGGACAIPRPRRS
jgi:hypothetical protein